MPLRVRIVYLIVPNYRVPLFEELCRTPGWEVSVQTCPEAPGFPKTAVKPSDKYDLNHRTIPILGGRARWMTGILDLKGLRKGDVLVCWGDPRFLTFLPLVWKAHVKGIKVMWWGQGYTAYSAGRVGLRQRLMRLADSVILYTQREVERYRAMGYDHPNLFAKNNSLDQAPIEAAVHSTSAEQVQAIRDQYALSPGKTLVTVGRLMPKMQLDLAIRALALPEMADYKLLVIGDGDMRSEWESVAQAAGVSDRVIWVGAIWSDEKMAPFLLASDVFVYPGAIGLSIFHAFGFGLPVVTHGTEDNQMPEFAALEPGVNGAIFEENSVDGLAQAIGSLDVSANRDNLREAALQTVQTWRMEETVRMFREAVEATSKL